MSFMMDDEELRDVNRATNATKKQQKAAMTVDFRNSARPTARSPHIPFPNYHVPHTRSELELVHDKERANQHQLAMFHRLVNGIRERQKKLGLVTDTYAMAGDDPSNPQATSRANGRFPLLPPQDTTLSTQEAYYLPQPTKATTTQQVDLQPVAVTVPQDDWSISGFESHADDGSTTSAIEVCSLWQRPSRSSQDIAAPMPYSSAMQQGTTTCFYSHHPHHLEETTTTTDDQEDIFQLDL